MREISFVKRLKFNFNGGVTKRALVIGDADNDQRNELVCANLQGDLAIFKDKNPNRYAYANELGMVTACVLGDVINSGKNYVAAINTEGWLFIFDVPHIVATNNHSNATNPDDKSAPQSTGVKLSALYDQRMPANCKELLLADLDGDGQNEVIVGLTDRVLRTYKWIKIGPDRGKFVGLNKWEFAYQIGAVSLSPSMQENCQDIIVAQPGGTYAKLECFDKKPATTISSKSTATSISYSGGEQQRQSSEDSQHSLSGTPNNKGDNVKTEYISKLTPEYHQLALPQMRNHHVSTEVLGGIRDRKNSNSYSLIVIATLDGTLMLVNKDEILWSLQVDHQLFALSVLECKDTVHPPLTQSESSSTIVPNLDSINYNEDDAQVSAEERRKQSKIDSSKTTQYFVVCAWNGKTYIIDEERNYLRFKFDEAVSAFTAGNYYFDGSDHACLAYATFNNQIVLYYDVILDHIRPMYLLNEIINNPEHSDLLERLETLANRVDSSSDNINSEHLETRIYNLLQDLLFSVSDEEDLD